MEKQDITSRHVEVTRREAVMGGLLLGGLFLTGCQSNRNSGLPGPKYPFEGGKSDGAELARNPPVYTPPRNQPSPQPPSPQPIEAPSGVIARSQWTRMGIARPTEINPMNGIHRITIHHDAVVSTDLRSTADVVRRIENTRAGHVQRGWADIGYHYIVDPWGRVWEGRSISKQGAHVEDNNEHNLGIMVLGNFDIHAPSPAATMSLERFYASQMRRYNVPISRVYTHREIKPTRCPGERLQRFMITSRGRGGGVYSFLSGERTTEFS